MDRSSIIRMTNLLLKLDGIPFYCSIRLDPQVRPRGRNFLRQKSETLIEPMFAGAPKPIEMNHGTFAVADNDRNLPPVPGRRNQNYSLWEFHGTAGRYYSSFPPFHVRA